jgi:zona occludens toxin
MIGDTASITLLTGLPGSGKTLRTVHFIKRAIEAGEVVFVTNLNGLKVPHIPFEDPREWEDLPPGSILVVDEAQQFFRTRRGGEAPAYLTGMETIRHKGVRLVLTTQQPDYLDAHLRGLVGLHEHLVRENGKEAAKIWRHNEVMDNVRSERARSRYDSEVWAYPPELFALYESAQVHTVKKRLSSRFKRGLIFAAAAIALGAVFAFRLPSVMGWTGDEAQTPERAGREASPLASEHSASPTMTPAEWAERFVPRVPQAPMSAPAYDDRPIQSVPRIACALGERMGCVCLTEQGTRYELDQFTCTDLVAKGGMYDPFRAPDSSTLPPPADDRKASAPELSPGLVQGIGSTADLQAGYGDFRR